MNVTIPLPSHHAASGSITQRSAHQYQRHRNLRQLDTTSLSAHASPLPSPNSSSNTTTTMMNTYQNAFMIMNQSTINGSPPPQPNSMSTSHVTQLRARRMTGGSDTLGDRYAEAKLKKQLDLNFLSSAVQGHQPVDYSSSGTASGIRPASSPRLYGSMNHTAAVPSLPRPIAVTSSRIDSTTSISRVDLVEEKRRHLNASPSPLYTTSGSNPTTTTLTNPIAPPPYYSATHTFRGEDVHHSSNQSFNQQLQQIKQRLRDQRRQAANIQSITNGREELNINVANTTPLITPTQRGSITSYHGSILPSANGVNTLPSFSSSVNTSASRQRPSISAASTVPSSDLSRPSMTPASHPYSNPTRRGLSSYNRMSDSSEDDSDQDPRPRRPSKSALISRRDPPISSAALTGSSPPTFFPSQSILNPTPIHSISRSHFDPSPLPSPSPSPASSPSFSYQPLSSSPGSSVSSSISASPAPISSATSPPMMIPSALQQMQILPVRATADLLRQRAAAAAAAKTAIAVEAAAAAEAAAQALALSHHEPIYASPQTGTHFAMSTNRPVHITAVPSYLEPFYSCVDRSALLRRLRQLDEAKLVRQQQLGCTVVYDSIDTNPEYTVGSPLLADRSIIPPEWLTPPGQLPYYYVPHSADDTTLVFESRFESGNLRRAIQVDTFEYDLLIRPDINTNTYAQWFYFSIRNTRTSQQSLSPSPTNSSTTSIVYKFNIVNLQKSDSLFNSGMQPLIYSERKTAESLLQGKHIPYQPHPGSSNLLSSPTNGVLPTTTNTLLPPTAPGAIGWFRGGYDIAYYRSQTSATTKSRNYTLTFSLEMEYDMDTVYIAYCYPYTVTSLYRSLDCFDMDLRLKTILKQRTLCRTLGGNDVPLLMITEWTSPSVELDKRPAIVITARVHPGESNASWMMKGIIEFLLTMPSHSTARMSQASILPQDTTTHDLSQHASMAAYLRRHYIFYLVPCLNPDGVISGNYRCSLAGVDLNRQWLEPTRDLHPTIFKTKQLLERIIGRSVQQPVQQPPPKLSPPSTDEKSDGSGSPSAHPSPVIVPSLIGPPPPPSHPPREVALFCDLHGHSRAQNVFIYGVECDGSTVANTSTNQSTLATQHSSPLLSPAISTSSNSSSTSGPCRNHRLAERILPKLLAQRSPFFNLNACHYVVRKSKETTARVVVAKELGIVNSFTLEASFGGVAVDSAMVSNPPSATTSQTNSLESSKYLGFQFNTRMYEEMGWNLCQAIADYTNPAVYSSTRTELEQTFPVVMKEDELLAVEDSDDDGDGEGEVLRSKLRRKRGKKKKKNGKSGGRRARSKSSDSRRSAAAPTSTLSSSPSQTTTSAASAHVRNLLERLRLEREDTQPRDSGGEQSGTEFEGGGSPVEDDDEEDENEEQVDESDERIRHSIKMNKTSSRVRLVEQDDRNKSSPGLSPLLTATVGGTSVSDSESWLSTATNSHTMRRGRKSSVAPALTTVIQPNRTARDRSKSATGRHIPVNNVLDELSCDSSSRGLSSVKKKKIKKKKKKTKLTGATDI